MPVFCAAYGCNNRRSVESRFPRAADLRRQWEVAIRREGFVATESSKLCSEHFKPADFDRTGQIVRLRDGATPCVFKCPSHRRRPVATRNKKTLIEAEESLPVDLSLHPPERKPQPSDDHSYASFKSHTCPKTSVCEALGRGKRLKQEKLNTKARKRRAKKTVHSPLEDLKRKNHMNKKLKERLDFHSGKINK